MEIRKTEGKNSLWDDNKKYAIEEKLYVAATGKPKNESTITPIEISSSDDFLRLSIEIGKENQKSIEISKKLGFPFYTEKRIVTL